MKKCTKCKRSKDISKFRERPDTKDALQYWCKDCERRANRKRYVKKPKPPKKEDTPLDIAIKRRDGKHRRLKHRYGITIDDFEKMYEDQNGKCPICLEKKHMYGVKGMYVDHCHNTGDVRGLLCPRCNSLLGKFMEDKALLNRAINYLEKTKK